MKPLILALGILIISILIVPYVFADDLKDSIIIIKSDDFKQTKETVEYIKSNGGEIDAVFIPNVLIGRLPLDKVKIEQNSNIEKISANMIDATELESYYKQTQIGIKVWNKRFELEGMAQKAPMIHQVTPGPILNDNRVYKIDKVEKDNEKIFKAPPNSENSEYLYGDVIATIFLMESDGTYDSSTEDWTTVEETNVMWEIDNGLYWWVVNKPSNVDLTIYYNIFYSVPTKYEPINHSSDEEGLWINNAMNYVNSRGYDYYTNVVNYDSFIREYFDCDWAFSIFVVDSSNDTDGMFSDSSFAYSLPEYVVMTYTNDGYGIGNMDAVTAHETGHVFGAADQYYGAWQCDQLNDCSSKWGYLNVDNQNCEVGCLSDVPSIMRGDIPPYTYNQIDYYAKGQVGWRDLDKDSINDAIDSTYNTDSDNDKDGVGDYWDPDDDNDGVLDTEDECPLTSGITYYNGCPDIYPPIFGSWLFTTPVKTYNNISVSINVTDPSGVSSTILHYDYGNDGTEDGTTTMTGAGSIYTATIPPPGKNYRNTNIAFYVQATENLNQSNTGNSTKQLIYIENTPPNITRFSPENKTIDNMDEGDAVNFEYNYTDLDGDIVTSSWLLDSVEKAKTPTYTFLVGYCLTGVHNVTLRISDGLATDTNEWVINMTNVEYPPMWSPEPQNQTIQEDTNLSYQVNAVTCDNKNITYSVSDPEFSIDANGLLTWTPPANWFGVREIIINATSGTITISKQISIIIESINDAPILDSIGDVTVTENDLVKINPNATDVENDMIIFTFSSPLNASGEWQTTYSDAGSYTVRVTAEDSNGASTYQDFTITVKNDLDRDGIPDDGDLDDDGDGIPDDKDNLNFYLDEIQGNTKALSITVNGSENTSQIFTGTQTVEFRSGENPVMSLDFNFDNHKLNMSYLSITEQEENAQQGWTIINNLTLPETTTKTVYIKDISQTSNQVCIKDTETCYISEISNQCTAADETLLLCSESGNTKNGYKCTDLGDYYKIEGLKHSGVTEIEPFCGDGTCNSGESCSSCASDCGACPTPSSSGGGGGGSGGSKITTTETPCKETSKSCTPWSECTKLYSQSRSCQITKDCGGQIQTDLKWEDQDCTYKEPAKEEIKQPASEQSNPEKEVQEQKRFFSRLWNRIRNLVPPTGAAVTEEGGTKTSSKRQWLVVGSICLIIVSSIVAIKSRIYRKLKQKIKDRKNLE